jgi:hypothetical protein
VARCSAGAAAGDSSGSGAAAAAEVANALSILRIACKLQGQTSYDPLRRSDVSHTTRTIVDGLFMACRRTCQMHARNPWRGLLTRVSCRTTRASGASSTFC